MFGPELQIHLQEVLSSSISETSVEITSYRKVHGGDINEAYQLTTNFGNFFLKKNRAMKFPDMFQREVEGLREIEKSNSVSVPKVIIHGSYRSDTYLVLEWVEEGNKTPEFWSDFGVRLALMHQTTDEKFGFKNDNFIGSLNQRNDRKKSWSEFFVMNRIEEQLRLGVENKILEASHVVRFEKLFNKLDRLFPAERPALLHGDLWSGNFMVTEEGAPIIMDPAVYYGHREMDLAMTKLFGGFDEEMYEIYNEVYLLEEGWKERVDLCNLYPLLVHVNIFGSSYVSQVDRIVRRFV